MDFLALENGKSGATALYVQSWTFKMKNWAPPPPPPDSVMKIMVCFSFRANSSWNQGEVFFLVLFYPRL